MNAELNTINMTMIFIGSKHLAISMLCNVAVFAQY